MRRFNVLKKLSRPKRDKAPHDMTNPAPSGQHTPDTVQGSVDSGVGRQPTKKSAKTGLVDPRTNCQDGPDATIHTNVDSRPNGERTPDVPVVLLDIASSVSEATDLRDSLNFMSGALMKVLDTAKSISLSNEEWNVPLKRLQFHLDTIGSQGVTLEEDARIDKAALSPPLAPDSTIVRPLETYAKELNNIYRLLCDYKTADSSVMNNNAEGTSNDGIIAQKIRDMDVVFEEYTGALHDLAAKSIVQIKQEPQPDYESPDDAKKAYHKSQREPNAYGVQHVPCLQGTREKTLAAISEWADDKSGTKPIYLLLDVAGSGKSTIAKQMAIDWTRKGRLFARFFFSRDTAITMSTASFCSTVADAFAAHDPKFEASIKSFKERKDFGLLSFEERFHGLVTSPLEELGLDAILIVDALDECDNEHGSRNELLNTLYGQQSSIPRLRILATSRPELDIKLWAQKSGVEYATFIQLEGGDKDVEVYIKHRLQHVPGIGDRLYRVIKDADGVFIWARIACDLILDNDDADSLLEGLGKDVSLDYLYKVALRQSIPNNERSQQAFTAVLQMILASRKPLSIAELEMLSPKRGIVEQIVTRLGAVLLYKDRKDPIRLLHATFREFLTARSKAGVYFIQPECGHQTLALGCLRFLSDCLSLDDSALRELDPISQRTYIYSSQSWVHHCEVSYRKLALNRPILDFASNRLQTWANLADKWYELNTLSCLRDVLLLSRQNMSPRITKAMVCRGLETINTKMESEYRTQRGTQYRRRAQYGYVFKKDDEKVKKDFEDFKATLPEYE